VCRKHPKSVKHATRVLDEFSLCVFIDHNTMYDYTFSRTHTRSLHTVRNNDPGLRQQLLGVTPMGILYANVADTQPGVYIVQVKVKEPQNPRLGFASTSYHSSFGWRSR
jgi:hypothetical protein